MYRYLSSIRHARGSSLFSLVAPKPSPSLISAFFSGSLQNHIEHVRGFSTGESDPNRPFSMRDRLNENSRSGNETLPDAIRDSVMRNMSGSGAENERSFNRQPDNLPFFMQNGENSNSRGANYAQNRRGFGRDSGTRPFFMRDRENLNVSNKNDGETETEKSSRPMDFVRGVIDEDGQDHLQVYSNQFERDADFVHIKMLRNNTFVTVTDSKGNIKLSGSVGSVKEMKSGQKLARYAAEATSEVVGRRARGLGLKAVVMKVNGFTHFRRKRQAIMSWLEGFLDSRADKSRNPVVHIEDTTRKPHNGCRLPRKRRI
ncbi:hypothetical protein HN51_015195 [Arachis hypogaea]|uniref:Ribosomal protein S11 n=2 Tax=Arachis TaxID=3817 RepID=A0A445CLL3_ARAHY|nr:probable ribosomal protein S11, mitochondrial [Arachis duranensis]XP_025604396.1 probable ribosomal protein S11, mitochondrial [Arachis hypogaea]QHO04098.1 putative ribosomal protein [Arachis hypogaea]RYR51799.1 hypothetical protein Ahy_A06g026776 [Arachis hypogaea]